MTGDKIIKGLQWLADMAASTADTCVKNNSSDNLESWLRVQQWRCDRYFLGDR